MCPKARSIFVTFGGPEKSKFTNNSEEKINCVDNLRNMYFKILHNIYPTNLLLHRMKIKASPNCDYCGDIDHIIHMFFSCPSLKSFWESTTSLVQRILNDKISLGPIDIILGITKEEHGYSRKKIQEANHLLLISKYCII